MSVPRPSSSIAWSLLGACALAAAAASPRLPQDDNGAGTGTGADGPTTAPLPMPSFGGGSSADSNGRMIAVTGVDLTGSSVLYLVDTETGQLCVYQASGGSRSSQGVKLVGARNISLDLQLDGFNDRTESEGRPLRFKDLERMFQDQGLPTGD